MSDITWKYSPDVHALVISFVRSPATPDESAEVYPGVVVDFATDRRIKRIEIHSRLSPVFTEASTVDIERSSTRITARFGYAMLQVSTFVHKCVTIGLDDSERIVGISVLKEDVYSD